MILHTLIFWDSWLKGIGLKPESKRKMDDAGESGLPRKKFSKEMSQENYDWYMQDSDGKWHCLSLLHDIAVKADSSHH